jgi:hypothetical protein
MIRHGEGRRAIAFAPPSTPQSQTAAKSGQRWKSIKCFRVGPCGSTASRLSPFASAPQYAGSCKVRGQFHIEENRQETALNRLGRIE